MKTSTKLIIASTATLVAAAAAFGTVQVVGTSGEVTPAVKHSISASTPTPVVTKTPEAFNPATVKIGGTVQWADKLPLGFFAYQMPDQSYVAVNQDQPLPAAIEADLHQQAQTTIKPSLTATNASSTAGETATFLNDSFASTGKYIVIIVHTTGAIAGSPAAYQWFGMSSDWNPAVAGPTEANVEASARARIAASANPARYEVVVIQ